MPTQPYPWATLERVSRAELGPLSRAQSAWAAALDPDRIGAELTELVGTVTSVEVTALRAGPPARRFPEVTLRAGAATVTVGVEPDLAMYHSGKPCSQARWHRPKRAQSSTQINRED
jgi:hypothetical protein